MPTQQQPSIDTRLPDSPLGTRLPDSPQALFRFYKDRINDYTARVQSVQQRFRLVALLRLIVFVALSVAVYRLFKGYSIPGIVIAGVLLVLFILLVRFAFQLKDRLALWEKLLFVNTNESDLLGNALNQFDDGSAFPRDESYLDDLDIFGKSSLFHLLNRTTTS